MKNSTLDYFKVLNENKQTLLVKFSAPWCSPCKALTPLLEKIQPDYNNVEFIEIDITPVVDEISEMGITSVPTVMVFNNGQLVDKSVGLKNENYYRTILDSL